MDSVVIFYLLLFSVAFLYASVGHGGASGYLAMMALFSITPAVMKPTALVLNLFVSLISFLQFFKAGYFNRRIFIPLAMSSVPLAFVGGLIVLEGTIYKRVLGVLLLFPVVRFLFFRQQHASESKKVNILGSILIGGGIGFLSGLIGIGGGIILSPVLLLLHWADQKQAAALSAAFIFVNSASGLAGQLVRGVSFTNDMYFYVLFALAGGFIGSYYGARQFSQVTLKNVLATVLALAAFKLLFTAA